MERDGGTEIRERFRCMNLVQERPAKGKLLDEN